MLQYFYAVLATEEHSIERQKLGCVVNPVSHFVLEQITPMEIYVYSRTSII